jgi:ParB/RepB/Spo0J family partition protein
MVEKRPALGRGLSALIPDSPTAVSAPSDRALEIDTDLLRPNKFQPRSQMDDDRIEDLARSIRSHGIIQPIVARRAGEGYEIIAGERRWRAAQRAGLLKVPEVVRDIPDDRLLAVALIENIQREDLNPIEEAVAYRRRAEEFLLRRTDADAVGKDRSSIANYVRLRLPQEVRANVASNAISMGHARAAGALRRSVATPPRTRDRREEPLGARRRSPGEEGKPGREDRKSGRQEGGRQHARRGRQAAPRSRHARPDQSQGQGRTDRNRFRQRRGITAPLRAADGRIDSGLSRIAGGPGD